MKPSPLISLSTVLAINPTRLKIVRLHYLFGFTQQEIAFEVGLSRRTVAYHLEKAILQLRQVPNLVIDL